MGAVGSRGDGKRLDGVGGKFILNVYKKFSISMNCSWCTHKEAKCIQANTQVTGT